MPATAVQRLAGDFSPPQRTVGDHDRRLDLEHQIREFAYWSVILGYTRSWDVTEPLWARLDGDNSVWAATLGHLMHVGQLLGAHRTDDDIDWFGMAIQSIERLKTASDVARERTPDALDAARFILPDSLRWASEVITERCPQRMNEWIDALVALRGSFIWTTHYGINEQVHDYSFEFPIWRGLTHLGATRHNLQPVLVNCAESYARSTKLKGGSRGGHFLELSAIAARCGFRDNAEEWLQEGVNSTLSYGYRKDNTLMTLADVLRRVNRHKREKAFARSAAVLEMIKWMPNVTDGSITRDFPQEFFPVVLNADRQAGLNLLRVYYERFGRWQANECAETCILSCNGGDPEYLWALASLLHPNESLKCRQHIVGLPACASATPRSNRTWPERLKHYVTTSVNPRLWPEDLCAEASPKGLSDSAQKSGSGGIDGKPMHLDGVVVTEDHVIELCKQSVSAMIKTLDKLRAQNEHISDYRILNAAVPYHIQHARTDEELEAIETLIGTTDIYARASDFSRLGSRYIQRGNLKRGTALLEKAFRDSVSTTTVESCITTLVRFDKGAARKLCIDGIRDSLEASYRGLDTPCIVAAACEVFGEIENLDRVFDDYLIHCQELFRHLPDEPWFDWLKQYVPSDRDENSQIVSILIDQLAEPEIELGRRLMTAMCELCCECGSSVVDIMVDRVLKAEGLQQGRLLQVLHAVAYSRPESIRQSAQAFALLLEQTNAAVKLLVRDTLRAAFREVEAPNEVAEALAQIDRDYSSLISYRTFGIGQGEASSEFGRLLERAALVDFRRQLEGCCDVLSLDTDQMIGHLERRFTEQDGSIEDEIERYKYDWRGYVHPQGWPVTWIIPSFHVEIAGLLCELLDEILSKTRVHPRAVEAIWRILQPSDPRYLAGCLSPKPPDVPSLVVTDEDQWFAKLETTEQRSTLPDFESEWVTAFEYRQMAHAGTHEVDCRSTVRTSTALVRPEHLDAIHVAKPSFEHEIVTHHPYENVTWDQFCQAIRDAAHLQPDDSSAAWPVTSTVRSPIAFMGFHSMASLCPYIMSDHDLEFSNFLILRGTDPVARYEMWREGWFSSDYCDEPMAFGCRLQVRTEFLRSVCSLYRRAFVVRTEETRECYESYKRKPVRSQKNATYAIVPISPHLGQGEVLA